MGKKVEKIWVAFGLNSKDSMGVVIQESSCSVHIKYSEAQLYPTEVWDKNYVKRFGTPEELAQYVYDEWGTYGYEEAMCLLREHFSSQFKNEKET